MTATRSRGSLRVDPRLAARRASIARKAGARRLRFIGALSILATVAILAIAASNSSWFDVDAIDVVGAERSDPRHVVNASGIEIGEPLIELDLGAATDAVERVPWVASADVDRDIDGTVTIAVTERVGVVAVPAGNRFAIIDRTGRQLELAETQPDPYLPVTGVEASGVPGQLVDETALAVVSLVDALTPAVRDATTGISYEQGRLLLELTVGGQADLGDERDLEAKLLAVETVLARVDLGCLAVIDVQVPDAPTVRRVDQTATTETGSGTDPSAGREPAAEEPSEAPGGC